MGSCLVTKTVPSVEQPTEDQEWFKLQSVSKCGVGPQTLGGLHLATAPPFQPLSNGVQLALPTLRMERKI